MAEAADRKVLKLNPTIYGSLQKIWVIPETPSC